MQQFSINHYLFQSELWPIVMVLLEYENQIFLEGFHNDGLFITAR